MNLNEALNVVQQVKNRYQAFEHLEELLTFFAGEYQKLESLKVEREKAIAETEDALRKRDTLMAEFGLAKKKLDEELNLQQSRSSSEIRRLQKLVQDESNKLLHKNEQVKAALTKLEGEFKGRIDAMKGEEFSLQESINKLREQMNNLRKVASEVAA